MQKHQKNSFFLLLVLIVLQECRSSHFKKHKTQYLLKTEENEAQEKLSACYQSCLTFYKFCDNQIDSSLTEAFYKCEKIVNMTVTETYCFENGVCSDCGACSALDKFCEIQEKTKKDELALELAGDLRKFCKEKFDCK